VPGLAGRPTLRRREEVLEWHVQEGCAGLGQRLALVLQPAAHADPPPAGPLDLRPHEERPVDRHGPAVADEDPRGDGGEAVPRRKQAARLVEERRDETTVSDPGPTLVALVEDEACLVALVPLARRRREPQADRIVAAAEAGRVVMGRDASAQRRPPRALWAREEFSEPAEASAAEAESSSASVAAATSCAKR